MRSDLSDEDRQFARRLVARRFASHLSRQSLARLTKISEATIKFIEKGRTKPTVRTIACLLQVPELELTLEDVPLLWREQVRDVLELPRVPVCEAAPPAPPSDGLRSCSGGGRAQLSTATLDTIAFLFQVSKLNLTLDDVPPWSREQVRAALKPDGLRPCSGGGRLAPPTPPAPPSSPSSVSPSADTTDPRASESAQPVPAVAQFRAGSSLLPSGTAPSLEAYSDRDTPPT